jgi:hypothetical protein
MAYAELPSVGGADFTDNTSRALGSSRKMSVVKKRAIQMIMLSTE